MTSRNWYCEKKKIPRFVCDLLPSHLTEWVWFTLYSLIYWIFSCRWIFGMRTSLLTMKVWILIAGFNKVKTFAKCRLLLDRKHYARTGDWTRTYVFRKRTRTHIHACRDTYTRTNTRTHTRAHTLPHTHTCHFASMYLKYSFVHMSNHKKVAKVFVLSFPSSFSSLKINPVLVIIMTSTFSAVQLTFNCYPPYYGYVLPPSNCTCKKTNPQSQGVVEWVFPNGTAAKQASDAQNGTATLAVESPYKYGTYEW